jgi:serine protease Do
LSVNGENIDSARDLTGLIADTGIGDTVKIKVLRDGKSRTFEIKIAKREETKISRESAPKEKQAELGIRVADITPETARRFNLEDTNGVIVVGIDSDSKAAESGLKVHDIIKEVNHQGITSVKDLDKAISEVETGEAVNLFIRRMNRGFLVIKITK